MAGSIYSIASFAPGGLAALVCILHPENLMGHGDEGLINEVYMHKSEIALDDAAEKINSFANRVNKKN